MPLDPLTDTASVMSGKPQSKLDDTTIGIFAAFFIITSIFVLAWCWHLARPRPFFAKPFSFIRRRSSLSFRDEHELRVMDAPPAGAHSEERKARRFPPSLTPYSIASPSLIPSPLNIFKRNREPVQSPGLPNINYRQSIDAESNLPRPARAWLSRFVPHLYRRRSSSFSDRLTSLGPRPYFRRSEGNCAPTIDELETRFAKNGLPKHDPLALPPLANNQHHDEKSSLASSSSITHGSNPLDQHEPAVDWRSRKSIDSSTHNNKWWHLDLTSPRHDQRSSSVSISKRAWNAGYTFLANAAAALTPPVFRGRHRAECPDASVGRGTTRSPPAKGNTQPNPTRRTLKKPTPLSAAALASGDLAISGPQLTPGSRRRMVSKYSSIQDAGPDAMSSSVELETDLGLEALDTLGSPGPTVSEHSSSSTGLYHGPRDAHVGRGRGQHMQAESADSHPVSDSKGKGKATDKTSAKVKATTFPKLQSLQTLPPTTFQPSRAYETLPSAGANPGGSGGYITSPQGHGSIGIALGSPRVVRRQDQNCQDQDQDQDRDQSNRQDRDQLQPQHQLRPSVYNSSDITTGTNSVASIEMRKTNGVSKPTAEGKRRRPSELVDIVEKPDTDTEVFVGSGGGAGVDVKARRGAVSAASGSRSRMTAGREDGETAREGTKNATEGVGTREEMGSEKNSEKGAERGKAKGKEKKRVSEMSCFNRHPGDRVKSP